jgi:hypothetical protein
MINPITDSEYYTELPEEYIVLQNYKELFKTNNGDDTLTTENSIIREGLILIVYNPQTKEYYPRYLSNCSDKIKLLQYFNDWNLYIKESDLIWNKK